MIVMIVRMASDLVGVVQAAESLGIQRRQVNNLIAAGILPAELIGNAFVIRVSDLAKVPAHRKPGPKPGTVRKRSANKKAPK